MRSSATPRSRSIVAYGPLPDQVGDLYLPDTTCPPVVCLLHGGFWRLPYGRDHIAPIAADLAARGFAVWNLEYRRVGSPGGGWPGTLQDVGSGIDYLATLAADGHDLDLARVAAVGHSAGGHLALWSALQGTQGSNGGGSPENCQPLRSYQPQKVRIAAAVGLAPVADLTLAYELRCGNGAVERFLGGSPIQCTDRYRRASPLEMLPLGVAQLLIHGTPDEDVPVEMSRRYAAAAAAAGDAVCCIELPNAQHMDFVDPTSAAHAAVCAWLASHL